MYAVREWSIDFVEQSHINNAQTGWQQYVTKLRQQGAGNFSSAASVTSTGVDGHLHPARNVQKTTSGRHHLTRLALSRVEVKASEPSGFSLDIRTTEVQELRWSHQISGTCFDTLPDLEEVTIILSYWHCLKGSWYSQAGTILAPSSGNITELNQMLLWNHPSMTMKPFCQGILAFDEARGLQDAIPLTTTIQALGHEALGTRIHLLGDSNPNPSMVPIMPRRHHALHLLPKPWPWS